MKIAELKVKNAKLRAIGSSSNDLALVVAKNIFRSNQHIEKFDGELKQLQELYYVVDGEKDVEKSPLKASKKTEPVYKMWMYHVSETRVGNLVKFVQKPIKDDYGNFVEYDKNAKYPNEHKPSCIDPSRFEDYITNSQKLIDQDINIDWVMADSDLVINALETKQISAVDVVDLVGVIFEPEVLM